MRIVKMQVHPIAIADPPLRSSYGLHAPYALRNILELTSEDGVVGVSETYGGAAPAEALEALRPRVVGADTYRLTGALAPMLEGQGEGFARSQTYLVPGENPLDAATRTTHGSPHSTKWSRAGASRLRAGASRSQTGRGSASNSTTTSSRAGASATHDSLTGGATTRRRCASTLTRTGSACCPVGSWMSDE